MLLKNLTTDNVEPCGYHVLIELLEVEETTESGIILAQDIVNREQAAMPIGKVLKVGPLAYKNHETGAQSHSDWGYEIGDYVQFPSHTYMKVAGEKSNLVFVLDHDIKAKVNIDE